MNTHLEIYSEKYAPDLERLLIEFSNEVFECGTASLESFVRSHWVIYLAIKGTEVVGFSSFSHNTYYGLRTPTIGQTYLYVTPKHRSGKTTYLLAIQAVRVCLEANLPLENYYASEASRSIGRKMKGTKIIDTYLYEVDELQRAFGRLTSHIQIKE
jgi:hypothetical protein